ncbi:hypothetical protein MJO28_004684 [Puccinia striiformis f. sp. tritici]|uniref:Uncharacterized protein n=3 Tax=Puccinia striiformis f. sp. tritici TaxID=168172 RepID=A0A0L0UUQ2_9BASI|nr:hypothetical protein MJO28_004684 [Puccinia striiformis f. sp. tritici]KAI9616658.1 hypothetical protein KEM48_005168 [Puccinia striiformis f. sp. tritici PST-130]KNE90666.1 hypothetical protein PSTG_15878 [Puccinia striiformis f. sp. tritici PST-78]
MSIVENNSSSPPSSSLSPLSSPPNETTTTSATPTPAATAATAAATNSILINQRNRFGSRQQSLALTQAALRRQAEQKDVHRPLPVTSPYAHLSIPSTPSSLTIQNNPHHHHHHHHHPNQPSNRSQQSPWAFRPSTPTTPLTQSPSTKPDKPAPICIGLLSSLVLILYRLEDFEIDHCGPDGKARPQTIPVRLCRFPPNGTNEILRVLSPTGEHFGVVEHKIGNVLGPLLGPVHSISGGSPVGGWSPNGASDTSSKTISGPSRKRLPSITEINDEEITETNGLGGPRLTQPIPAPNQSDGRQLFIECCVIRRGEQNPMMLPLQLLVFCLPDSIPSVATYLSQSGVSLEHPVSYHPEMHLGCLYDNPHSAQPREAMESIRQRLLGNSAAAHPNSQIIRPSLQACDTHHQVATIFKSLASGVDLDETEPGDMIVTSLYPHQKQALSFMLDRETPKTVPADLKTARNSAERKVLEKEDDENLVSLWKKTRDTYGRHVGWMNVVTGIQQVGKQTPPQCRGAILADDMGLGKTISIISLITATHQAAIEFAQSPIIKPTTQVVNHPSRNNNKSAKRPHSETLLDGSSVQSFKLQSSSTPYGSLLDRHVESIAAPKKEGAIAAKKRIAVHDRSHLIKLKSRATLIVCPLSTVQNWESQIEEHVRKIPASTTAGSSTSSSTPKSSLSVCVYHGNTRTSDVNVLADYDVVITTYSLLGYEFSRQNRSTKEAEEGNDSSDGVEEVDADGGSISNAQITNGTSEKNTQVKNNGKLKRKRKGDGLTSPLQAIEWFRVVLDEAHMIKEHTTTQSKAACDLLAERRVCLTGTPLQNSLNDLFSLVCFLRLEPFTDRAVWTTHIGTPARLGEPLGVSRLQLIMRHIALRRTKQTSDKHGKPILTLPPKKDDIVYLELNEAEKEFYSMYHQRSRQTFMTLKSEDTVLKNYCSILQELLRLRQICAHVGLVLDSEARSGRELDLARQIEQEGFSRSKAIHLLILMRDTGATQCSECGREAISASTADNEEDVEDLKAPLSTGSKRCRKKPNNLKQQQQQQQQSSSTNHNTDSKETQSMSVITRCQHLFCLQCYRERMCSGLRVPDGRKEEVVDCSVCLQQLSVSTEVAEISAAELQNNIRLEELRNDGVGGVTSEPAPNGVPKARSRKSKVATQKMKAIEPPEPLPVVIKADSKLEPDSKPSAKSFSSLIQEKGSSPLLKHGTKITQLLLDLLPFSQANPASFNFAPQDPMFDQDYNPNDPDADFKPTKGAVVKSVVFSQWTKLLDKIASALDEFNIQYKKLDGTMNRAERNRSMDALKADPKCEVLLVSLRAGGVGLNLTCAQRVYLMEPFWNPAVENQAVDRVHRLGQTKPVRMIRYIISGSVEQNMLEIQKRKTELANMSLGQTLSKEELAKRRVEDLHILFKENI